MSSLFLSRLPKEERKKLENQLWSRQNHNCFISEEPIDLTLDEVGQNRDRWLASLPFAPPMIAF